MPLYQHRDLGDARLSFQKVEAGSAACTRACLVMAKQASRQHLTRRSRLVHCTSARKRRPRACFAHQRGKQLRTRVATLRREAEVGEVAVALV